jgi:4-carboxymuconolactone decarboxylase
MSGGEPRIQRVSDPDADQADLLAKTLLPGHDEPLNVFATLAHHPQLLRRVNALGGLFMSTPSIPARARELAIIRVAVRCRSRYELAQHLPIGRAAGLSEDELDRAQCLEDGGWGAEETALLRAVDDLLERDVVDDARWEQLSLHYSTDQLLELLFLVGFYRMLAGYLRTVRVPLEAGMSPASVKGSGWV